MIDTNVQTKFMLNQSKHNWYQNKSAILFFSQEVTQPMYYLQFVNWNFGTYIFKTVLRQNKNILPGGYYIMDNPCTLAGTWYCMSPKIAKFMRQTWGLPESCRPQMDPMLVSWTLLSRTCPQFTSSIWWMLQPQTPGRYPSAGSCGEGWNLQRNTHVMTSWPGNDLHLNGPCEISPIKGQWCGALMGFLSAR